MRNNGRTARRINSKNGSGGVFDNSNRRHRYLRMCGSDDSHRRPRWLIEHGAHYRRGRHGSRYREQSPDQLHYGPRSDPAPSVPDNPFLPSALPDIIRTCTAEGRRVGTATEREWLRLACWFGLPMQKPVDDQQQWRRGGGGGSSSLLLSQFNLRHRFLDCPNADRERTSQLSILGSCGSYPSLPLHMPPDTGRCLQLKGEASHQVPYRYRYRSYRY